MKQIQRAMAPDFQGFDEVRIFTRPRFKVSGLSGDEWRISGVIQLFRKGQLRHEQSFRNVETACHALWWVMSEAGEEGKASYEGTEGICQQEGCQEAATVRYRVRKEFCRDHPHDHQRELKEMVVREFCPRHAKRGDAGFDDADENYELLNGTPSLPLDADISESQKVHIKVDLEME